MLWLSPGERQRHAYIRNSFSWGNAAPAVSADEVGKERTALVERSD
jgi:hypothetical protein